MLWKWVLFLVIWTLLNLKRRGKKEKGKEGRKRKKKGEKRKKRGKGKITKENNCEGGIIIIPA